MKYFFFIVFVLLGSKASSQIDSLNGRDSLPAIDSFRVDTSVVVPQRIKDTILPIQKYSITSDSFLYKERLFFSFTNPVRYSISEKPWEGKDAIFYSILALLLFFAFIKNSFSRYLGDLYSSYFRTTVRQRQIKEQLLQSPLPSLLFNIFFVISTGIFLSLIFEHFKLAPQYPFWAVTTYSAIGLIVIYGGKFLILKFFGWVFQLSEATDTYIFLVFSTNKILGVLLLPFSVLLAFTYGAVNTATVTLSIIVIGGLLAYRYFLSFISVNRLVQVNFFHFIIYLAAFEILPLLLINKVLFTILRELS